MSDLVANLQSMRDRMMDVLPKRYGDKFDGDFDILLEVINYLKKEAAPGRLPGWEKFYEVGERVQGCSLEYRRFGSNWPHPWRARIHSNIDGARVSSYGATAQEAMLGAIESAP